MAVLSLFQNSTATCTWRGCVTFKTGVFHVSFGGVTVFQLGTINGNIYVGRNEEEVRAKNNIAADVELKQDEDVLDTWFSSALWTFSTLGWTGDAQKDAANDFLKLSTQQMCW